MTQDNEAGRPFDELRTRAEDWLGVRHDELAAGERNDESSARRLIHELHVHQIELEMQNEELQQAQKELEEGLTRYTDLYEFAPVGYLTLNRNGVIGKVNLTGARLLGLERTRWVGRRLALLLAADRRSAFDAFVTRAFASGSQETHELALHPEGAEPITVELTATASEDGQECRLMAADITRCKRAEQANKELDLQLEQSQRMAALGALASGAAHDLDNVLAGIVNGLSLLELELDEAGEHRRKIGHVKALAERGADLTKHLLGFATGDARTKQ